MFNELGTDMAPQNKHKRLSGNDDQDTDTDSEVKCFTDKCKLAYLSTNDTMVPIYYYFGASKEQVKHCRLRLAICDLN